MNDIAAIKMPKWGLSMEEGTIVTWRKKPGDAIRKGEDLVDIETAKITNVWESPAEGTLRRLVAGEGETSPVGALIAVVADASVPESEIDAFVADFQSRFSPGEADADDANAPRLEMIEAGGRVLRIGRAGAGADDPVVLLHGYSGDLTNWMFCMGALAVRGPVLAIDLPGHGGSTKDVGDGSLASLARAALEAMDGAGVEGAHLVGHSLGAAVAARIAIDHPEKVRSLTLIAPAYMPGGMLAEDFLTGIAEGRRARNLKPWLEMLVADPSALSKGMVDDMVKMKRLDGVEEALCMLRDRMIAGDDARTLQSDLARIGRALVIASKADRIVGMPDEALLPVGLRVVWIDGVGHMPHLEKPDEVNALILEEIGRPTGCAAKS
ncbi:MAG: acetoin dehydrogenase dihydrolipoyllysine-residue acetyltransferase subunit [Alphaproteobacteria bacterium]|nr:acetoin dehydrogenase dihydrolipoyllysine-residue acetyltransferase subunit [Alphaproteobacteria bacterium]